jgi:hypothetical protein
VIPIADGVAITAGSGTTIASDDCASVHYQVVKLADGTNESTTGIYAGSGANANALRVTVSTDDPVLKSVAHDAADSGNAVKIGAKAISAAPTAVAALDRSDLYADLYGQLRVNDVHINHWSAFEDETDATANDEIKAAPGAGLSLYVTDLIVSNDATAAITFKLMEDTGGTPTAVSGTFKVAVSSSLVINFRTPIKLTAAKNLGYTATGTSNYTVQVCGFTAA